MFNPNVRVGEVLSEAEVLKKFGCQGQYGIRLSKKNNAIVIVLKEMRENKYTDAWKDGILYYTGTGTEGNQTLSGKGNNNGALKAVWDNPNLTTIFLLVKYAPNQCQYKGVVKLVKEPYQEERKNGSPGLVWKFPLKLVDLDYEILKNDYDTCEKTYAQRTEEELRQRIKENLKNTNVMKKIKRTAITSTYDRDSEISAYVKVRAHGYCDLCGNKAPFEDNGNPYLESHHVIWLSRGGDDTPENMVALCPNCHRKMHILDLERDKAILKNKIQNYNF